MRPLASTPSDEDRPGGPRRGMNRRSSRDSPPEGNRLELGVVACEPRLEVLSASQEAVLSNAVRGGLANRVDVEE